MLRIFSSQFSAVLLQNTHHFPPITLLYCVVFEPQVVALFFPFSCWASSTKINNNNTVIFQQQKRENSHQVAATPTFKKNAAILFCCIIKMCVQDSESPDQDLQTKSLSLSDNSPAQMDNSVPSNTISSPLESICENTIVAPDEDVNAGFFPTLRSGEWCDIGGRTDMQDTHVSIADLAQNFGQKSDDEEAVSFYGVFDGHGGQSAAHFVRDHLPRVIVEDADFPLKMEKVVTRSFVETDTALAQSCSAGSSQACGTTALAAMIFGRSLLVANAGDTRAVLSRRGIALEMSKDHTPLCINERSRVESLGGRIEFGYLNGDLAVTRALGDWHLEGMKQMDPRGGPLSAEPELKLVTLTKEDEFLLIASDGIWEFFSNQNAVDFARRRLQRHNDVKLCCRQIVEEAIQRGATDNLTVILVSFHLDPPPPIVLPQRTRVRRSISAEGLQNLRLLLDG